MTASPPEAGRSTPRRSSMRIALGPALWPTIPSARALDARYRAEGENDATTAAGQQRAQGQPARAGLYELWRSHHARRARMVARRRAGAAVLPAGDRAGHHLLGHRERLSGGDIGGGCRPGDQALLAARGHRARDQGLWPY